MHTTILFLIFYFLIPLMLFAAPAEVPKTGQKVSYSSGDDGAKQVGIPWPEPRFTDNNNGTVTDKLTGLVWLKDANCFGIQTWEAAVSKSNNLGAGNCGLSDGSQAGDWRLPNIIEFKSLLDIGSYNPALPQNHPFLDISLVNRNYWSSSYSSDYPHQIRIADGTVNVSSPITENGVWPVRDGQINGRVHLPKTGITSSFATGDDGDLQKGVEWSVERFIDNGNGTVTDTLTDLIWLKNSNCFGRLDWNSALEKTNSLANGSCGLKDGSNAGDWQLPNFNDLSYLQIEPNLEENIYFSGFDWTSHWLTSFYWSSNTLASNDEAAWSVDLRSLSTMGIYKNGELNVWPVRKNTGASLIPPYISYTINNYNLRISWDRSSGSTGYKLYYAPYPYVGPESIKSFDVGNNNHFTVDLWKGASFYIAVKAYNDQESSPFSNIEKITIPNNTVPESPQLSYNIDGTSLSASWGSVPGATGYKLYYTLSGYTGQEAFLPLDVGNQTSFFYQGLTEGQTYSIAVVAYNDFGESDFSNVAQLTVEVAAPNPEWVDDDGDGFTENQGDCNDENSSINPGAAEVPSNGIDDNCNDQTDEEAIVEIEDENLQACIDAKGLPYDQIQSLSCISKNISSLDGIQLLSNLKWLTLTNNKISDVSPLWSIVNLEHLSLDGNYQISDVLKLKSLTNLRGLGLSYTQVRDLNPLNSMTKLTALTLNNNQITDVTPLQNLTNLTFLSLISNQVRDIAPLQNMTKLTILSLAMNQITDVTPLQNMTKINFLALSRNCITNFNPVSGLPNLTTLTTEPQNTSCQGSMGELDTDNDGDGFTENQGDCNDTEQNINPLAEDICGDGIDQSCSGSDQSCSSNDLISCTYSQPNITWCFEGASYPYYFESSCEGTFSLSGCNINSFGYCEDGNQNIHYATELTPEVTQGYRDVVDACESIGGDWHWN